ncbi:MAG: cobalamin-binding protein [Myxococcales bacterium]
MPAPRIVSLLPAATEMLFALGLGENVVGVSHECDFPASARDLPRLTSPGLDPHAASGAIDRAVRDAGARALSIYRIDEPRLRALAPDLIVTQDACAVCAVSLEEVRASVARLFAGGDRASPRVLSLQPLDLEDVLHDLARVATAAGAPDRAAPLAAELRARLARLRARTAGLPRTRTLVLEWLDPPMPPGHWTPGLIRDAGGEPLLAFDGGPTRPLPWDEIGRAAAGAEVILAMPCGFPVEQTLRELPALVARPELRACPAVMAGRVFAIDGNAYFNRPGPRLVEGAELAARYLHPGLSEPLQPLQPLQPR